MKYNYHKYVGTYPLDNKNFACYCWATSFEDAQNRFDAWNIGAKCEGVYTNNMYRPVDINEPGFEHFLIYVAFLAISSGKYGPEILADNGAIHEMMHIKEGVVNTTNDDHYGNFNKILKELSLCP